MKCGFIVKHRGFWPTAWLCEALGVSRGGFYAWLTRPRSRRARRDEVLGVMIRASFLQSDRTYGARRVWHDLLAEGEACGLHRIERLMRQQALRARPRRRRVPANAASQSSGAVSPNVLNRQFDAPASNRNGWPTSRISGRPKGGSTSLPFLISSPDGWWAGRCRRR